VFIETFFCFVNGKNEGMFPGNYITVYA